MKLHFTLFVILMMTDACWSQCTEANWWGSFDNGGWSTCNAPYEFMTGLWRNDREGGDPIYLIELAKCCMAPTNVRDSDVSCVNANWWGALDNQHTWAVCPEGYFMQGLYRTGDNHELHNIEEAKCCKLDTLPASYENCYNHNVWGSFDGKGWSHCNDGYYMAGIYRSDCDDLYCLEEFKCCSMKGPQQG